MSLHWGPLDYLAIVLILSWPGVLLGTLYGAVGWQAHRISGGVLGAIIGCLVCLAAFFAWNASDLSVTLSFPETALLPLWEGLPGLLAGLFVGAALWRERRIFGAACGALLGAALWLSGWFYFEGHQFHGVEMQDATPTAFMAAALTLVPATGLLPMPARKRPSGSTPRRLRSRRRQRVYPTCITGSIGRNS